MLIVVSVTVTLALWVSEVSSREPGTAPCHTQLSCIVLRAHLERMTFHDSFSRQPSRKTAGFHKYQWGAKGRGLLDPQVQMATLTLQCDT